jgi:putative transposase
LENNIYDGAMLKILFPLETSLLGWQNSSRKLFLLLWKINILNFKKMLKSYKYKLIPNEDQKVLLNKHFGAIRFIYNYFLNERKQEYETNKQTINYYNNAKSLTELKKQEQYSWLNEINSQSLQDIIKKS